MMYLDTKTTRTIFIQNPRTASSSMTAALKPFALLRMPPHLTFEESRSYGNDGDFSFVFVRNPWDRLVSAGIFSCFFYKEPPIKENLLRWFLSNINIMSAPQVRFIVAEDDSTPLFIGRYENLEEDFKKACKTMGVTVDLPYVNPSERASKDYRAYYDDETRAWADHYYAEDIKRFGYEF